MMFEPMAARTMEELRAPATTWASDVRAYERQKRSVVDDGLLGGPQVRVTGGQTKLQERAFDPLLQRYRDGATEASQRLHEERERVSHLNRAQDIEILRGQPFHIINHHSKLEKLAPGLDPTKRHRTKVSKGAFPNSIVDFNIISNIPTDVHHPCKPEDRPTFKEREPQPRNVPAFLVKDFNIVNNRYHEDHDERVRADQSYRILDAAKKYMHSNKFDPLTQEFTDPRVEERSRTCDDVREAEIVMRAEHAQPPTLRGRQSAHYDVISHEVHNPDIIDMYDRVEVARKDRFRNRHIVEHNLHAQDVKGDHITEARRQNRVGPERYQEDAMRGFDIIDNRNYGHLNHEKPLFPASTKPRLSPWEKANLGRAVSTPPNAFHQPEPASSRRGRGRDAPAAPLQAGMGVAEASKHDATLLPAQPMARPAPTPQRSEVEAARRAVEAGGSAHSAPNEGRMAPSQASRRSAGSGAVSVASRGSAGGGSHGGVPGGTARLLAEAGGRALSGSASAQQLGARSSVAQGPPARSLPAVASAADLTQPRPFGGDNFGGGTRGPTMRRLTPSAPPAPAAIPGSPTAGSVYSRPSMR